MDESCPKARLGRPRSWNGGPLPDLSIVIPTLRRAPTLRRTLDRLARQDAGSDAFEVLVVADAAEPDPDAVDAAVGSRPYPVRRLAAAHPGASSARNLGVGEARASLVLFLDDDVLPGPRVVSEHLAWHRSHPEEEIGVLGHVRWARQLRVSPFMRWLERGVQFDYSNIEGVEAGWGRFYTANASVKRRLVARVGGFDADRLPFGYEDLDLAYRMSRLGFRLLYNRRAEAEHLHPMDLAFWRGRVRRIAFAERRFTELHPELPPYFHRMFAGATMAAPARGRGRGLLGVVPAWVPWLGRRVERSADLYYRQALAPHFLAAWEEAGTSSRGAEAMSGATPGDPGPAPGGES